MLPELFEVEYVEDELAQTAVFPEIEGAGEGLIWNVVLPAELVHPLTVAVTEYTPVSAVVGEVITGFWLEEL